MNLKFSIKYFLQKTDGIGQRKEKPSQRIHSYSTRSRYLSVVHQMIDHLKEKGINRLDKVQKEHITTYFSNYLDGKSEKTAKVHCSALVKFFSVLERPDLVEAVKEARGSIEARQKTDIQGFSDPEKVISSIRNETSRAIAEIQFLTGARIGDIKKIEITERGIRIEGSKGGRDREISLSQGVKERVEKCLSQINFQNWRETRESYYNDLKQAVCQNKELYTGAHAFRANFAANRYLEYRQAGLNEKEAVLRVSQDLGHNREDISQYYIARGK